MRDTAPIRPDERFDEERVAAYLRTHVGDLVGSGPIEFLQFPGGAANLTYLARTDAVELVLRRAPLGSVAKGGHDMEREYGVLSRLWKAYSPAPRAYHYCDAPEVMGKPFFVMERREGLVVRLTWPREIGDDEGIRRSVTENLVDGLATLHRVDPDTVGLGDLGRPDEFVSRQVDGWVRRWDAARTREVADMDRAAEILSTTIPDPQGTVLLHNDYKLDNTMVDERGSLVAVFDWDMATRGDPLVDLGTLVAYWVDPAAPSYGVLAGYGVPLAPVMSIREVADRYATSTGFDIDRLPFYEGLALFRVAVIIEQIYARYAAGQTSDDRFARFEPAAPILARAAVIALDA
ncbi:MAG: phosphotransferase family protein [Actinomycetota bacterium]|nr:phosphotransferase family protein [Actinomycetota bacterium]